MNEQDKNWSSYWQSEGVEGEVFVNKEGGRHPFLASYWQQQFNGLEETAKVIDIAAGAGSIYSDLPNEHGFELHAADISAEALTLLKQRIPSVMTHTCPATAIPLADGSFDRVVSQFGVEYAGQTAFLEAGRLVKSGGKLSLLCHYQNGFIDARNQNMLSGAETAKQCEFLGCARALVETAFGAPVTSVDGTRLEIGSEQVQANFNAARIALEDAIKTSNEGVHAHLYFGFKQLFERREAYDLADITSWLDAMAEDLQINIMRLNEMCQAALSVADIEAISAELANLGFTEISATPINLPEQALPVGWSLIAHKA